MNTLGCSLWICYTFRYAFYAHKRCNEIDKLLSATAGMKSKIKVFVGLLSILKRVKALTYHRKSVFQECQHQFRNERWNCSTPYGSGYFGPVHKIGSREAAYTYSILSAGVTHEIGRRCRLGLLQSCGCSQAPRPSSVNVEWTWGGCGDNIEYGYRFSRDFIDVREKEEGFPKRSTDHGRSLMNRWNNEVGRRLLKRNTRPKCKCHGVSGSCNMKTCWMQLPTMRQMGAVLLGKYRSAKRIQINARGNMQIRSQPGKRDRERGGGRKNRALQTELVFLDDSPDYCVENRAQGTMGTTGRICRKGSHGSESCDFLCCGRGYNSYTKEIETKCRSQLSADVCGESKNLDEISSE
uniref:Protein Wnt n=1 Tax=Setaria digitata TaxID=48799 RepID=A0A915PX77_9BILA